MKMTNEQKLRLKALLAKAIKDHTAEEAAEFKTLSDLAAKEGYDPTADDDVLTEAEVKRLVDEGVTAGVTKALKGLGIDQQIVSAVETSLKGKPGITQADLDAAIAKHLGGQTPVDAKALAEEVKKHLSPTAGITQEQLDKAFDSFSKSLRSPSRHEFGAGGSESDFPIEHRRGNLTVAQKQLLNVCLMSVSPDARAKSNGGRGVEMPANMNDGIPAEVLKNATLRGEMAVKAIRGHLIAGGGRKALTTGGSGTGAELVSTDLSSELQQRLYLESAVAAEMVAMEIDMPSDPFKLPMVTTRPTFYLGSENPGSNPTASDPGTASVTLDAAKLIGMVQYSYEADEDSLVAILPMIQAGLGAGAADALESAFINGDTTATHQDSDIHAVSGHAAKAFKGFRKLALAGSLTASLATGGISAANVLSVKKLLKKYGLRPRDLMLICGVNGYNDLVGLDETLTADKVGNNVARILTGEAPVLYGMRIIPSSACREDLNASGVYDGSTTTKGSLIIVHKPSFVVGVRRGITVEVDVDKKQQLNSVVASFRRAFMPMETPSTTISSVALGYNYTA